MWQTAVVLALFLVIGGTGYHILHSKLQAKVATPVISGAPTSTMSPLGDVSTFKTITQDTLDILNTGNQTAATVRIKDLEYAWDQAQPVLKARNTTEWTKIDKKIDTALRELRAVNPNATSEKSALEALLMAL